MSKLYQIKEEIFYDENLEGIYLLTPSGNTLILDDVVAKYIWSTISNKASHEHIVNELMGAFNLDQSMLDEVKKDVTEFLSELEIHDVIGIYDDVEAKQFH
ncbi:hypothetical protein ABIC22_001939 [Paenibacillus sp. PvP094]|uniref:PqqD family peptide modification chaperone n=1 Tax=Paenibacillus sp. PvP094 TaxID=3156394 RepID=UPI0033984E72